MAAMYSAANAGGMSPKKRNTRMTNLGFPGGARPVATTMDMPRPRPAVGADGRGPSITTADGRISTRDLVAPNRQRVVGAPSMGRPVPTLLPMPGVLPADRRQRNADILAEVGRITNFPARPMMPRPQTLAPVQNIGLPQGELPIMLPDLSGPDYAALRERAMQDYFNQLAGLGL